MQVGGRELGCAGSIVLPAGSAPSSQNRVAAEPSGRGRGLGRTVMAAAATAGHGVALAGEEGEYCECTHGGHWPVWTKRFIDRTRVVWPAAVTF